MSFTVQSRYCVAQNTFESKRHVNGAHLVYYTFAYTEERQLLTVLTVIFRSASHEGTNLTAVMQ